MGIRTRETTEYFPKVRNCEQTATAVSSDPSVTANSASTSTNTANNNVNTVPIKIPVPTAPVVVVAEEVKVQETEKVKGVNDEKKKKDDDEKVTEEKIEEQNEQNNKPIVAASNNNNKKKGVVKIKNGIVKVNSKMKKGVKNMMERTNKILERSRSCKKATKTSIVKVRPPAARSSARLCRKNSGDTGDSNDSQGGDGERSKRCEEPLRTVELIKRPLELRDPATKLLYLASMGLYPMSDPESDSTPIVIISEEVVSPGGKKTEMSRELPLMPSWGNAHNNHNSSQRQAQSDNSLLLQIAPISARSATKSLNQPVEGSVPQKSPDLPTPTGKKRKSGKKLAEKADSRKSIDTPVANPDNLGEKGEAPPKIQIPSLPPPLNQTNTPTVKEIPLQINCGVGTTADQTSTNNITIQQPSSNQTINSNPVGLPPPPSKKGSAAALKKRKSLETIIKEIPKLKSDLPLQKIQSENMPQTSLPVESLSCNPILEGLMKNPPKPKRAPKRKPQTDQHQNQTSHFQQNPITMTVPLQPAPGLPNNNLGLAVKDVPVKPKKSKTSFQLPTLLPSSLLSFTSSLLPNNNNELTFVDKPKKPRKPRVKKPKEIINNFSQQNNFMSSKPNNLNQFPQLPYLPPHLEAFFHNANVVPMNPDVALDLCVKRTSDDYSFKAKKAKDMMMPQSILKPLSSRPEDDGPLNLVLSRPQQGHHLSSNTMNDPLPLKSLPENTKNIPQENLDSVKQMLARLHTNIAPTAVNGVQLITIE